MVKVLSLFDGISCGMVAFDRAGIPVEEYHACEIDKYAIEISQKNYPAIVRHGSVVDYHPDRDFDYLIGGSPCQGFSYAGAKRAFEDPRSKLFFEYVRILKECRTINPEIKFLLENVRMKKEHLSVISELLGVEPIAINSALVSAQNRTRYYWMNWTVEQPKDAGLSIKDVSLSGLSTMNPVTASRERTKKNIRNHNDKAAALVASMHKGAQANGMTVIKDGGGFRCITPIECERFQTLPDDYTNGISKKMRYHTIGNGWTVDVIAHILRGSK